MESLDGIVFPAIKLLYLSSKYRNFDGNFDCDDVSRIKLERGALERRIDNCCARNVIDNYDLR
jgi:hypothetical protein